MQCLLNLIILCKSPVPPKAFRRNYKLVKTALTNIALVRGYTIHYIVATIPCIAFRNQRLLRTIRSNAGPLQK